MENAEIDDGDRAKRAYVRSPPVKRLFGQRGVQPRMLLWAMGAIVLAALMTFAYFYAVRPLRDAGVELAGFSQDSTETVSFAGSFPPEEMPALANPLALAERNGIFFVAESEAGVIRVFAASGGGRGAIRILPREGLGVSYPADVASLDERTLVVLEATGRRVLLVEVVVEAPDAVFGEVGAEDPATAPVAPTAVAVAADRILVADSGLIRRYDADGRYVDSIGQDLTPPLGAIGGLTVVGDHLYVSDSNTGRVLVLDLSTGDQRFVLDKVMDLPRGTTRDGRDRIYVADRFRGAVEVFEPDGSHAETFGDGSRTSAALVMPNDVVWFGETSRIYVVDAAVGRIAVFNVRSSESVGE